MALLFYNLKSRSNLFQHFEDKLKELSFLRICFQQKMSNSLYVGLKKTTNMSAKNYITFSKIHSGGTGSCKTEGLVQTPQCIMSGEVSEWKGYPQKNVMLD